MPKVVINSPESQIEARYMPARVEKPDIAMVMHPHPNHGGNMNSKIVYNVYKSFVDNGFATLRFNFRGVGKKIKEEEFDPMQEVRVASACLDWLEENNTKFNSCWLSGFSFGAWVSMQILVRRPEVFKFIAINPPISLYDFSFISSCKASGLVIQSAKDEITSKDDTFDFCKKLVDAKKMSINYTEIKSANHFFDNKMEKLSKSSKQLY